MEYLEVRGSTGKSAAQNLRRLDATPSAQCWVDKAPRPSSRSSTSSLPS
ncbi:hypothetical protein H257_01571 [Aphanomyces astaci]|uniref:Uncharacterized protein n=1 Tax=Aphanomyces astaci TaxID=112090 RepID=W4HAH1_APHAT|nr:hypothetical protein H257_01571 [Aphanomyces astaci]ETV88279.1 hypothetical protein H257_01571 [Aphanomyces astaci]|eukprot:XP_009823142.1 hypothetical protein H257_01571 [Aphanomyces astaci]